MTTDLELAEPYLRQVLSTAGLDVEYVRGSGDTLFYRDADGGEVAVLDVVGGYGSTLFGHSNPRIVDYARRLLAEQTPIHAQFSRHPYANDVAAELNRILRRETGSTESYYAIFANSGAEAIEAALKHAELDRVLRVAALTAEIDGHVAAARAEVPASADLDKLLAELATTNQEQLARPPLYLTPEGAFHGKLVGSVQLTHNENYRSAFRALAAQARFVPKDSPGALKRIIEEERAYLLDVVVEDGAARLVARTFPLFCAIVLEPIQGEGGIHELSPAFLDEIQQAASELDLPIVVDEIQSGMGRTGRLLASSHSGLRGDYYALAKSLGGGVAKAAVMLVRDGRYRRDFEMMHSSTFAKDSFSCLVAREVLRMLEEDGGRAYAAAAERGDRLRAALEAVRAEYPEVLKEVRGRGLMLGLEFHDVSGAESEALRGIGASGFFGYFLAGYLLREHRIRIFPTASAMNTLRFEPSVYLTDGDIDRIAAALRDVAAVIHRQEGERLAPIA